MELTINVIHGDNTETPEYRRRKYSCGPSAHQLGLDILKTLSAASAEFSREQPPIVLGITLVPA